MEGMTPAERDLLARAIGSDAEPALCLRSGTRIDAGWWLRRAPVWLCITDDQAIVLAAGRRCHVASVARAECRGSRYDHATGEVVIEPGDALRFDRLAFPPREALRILHLLGAES
jgi:hypothetical protein